MDLLSEIRLIIREIICEMTSSIMPNSKTLKSIDVDTICPRKEFQEYSCMPDDEKKSFLDSLENMHIGYSDEFIKQYEDAIKSGKDKQCGYCYVRGAREKYDNSSKFSLAKPEFKTTTYNGEILGLRRGTIDKLNSMGGIRLFSHSDYKPRNHDRLEKILDDCDTVGLKVKAITKVPQFVVDFVNHPAVNLIHLSVDAIDSGVNHELAIRLKNKYPDKIRIRAVINNVMDLLDPVMEHVDVFTFYHGSNKIRNGVSHLNFSALDRYKISKGTYDPSKKVHDLSPELKKGIIDRMNQLSLSDKTCCVGENGGKAHCTKCSLKCSEKGCSV